MRIWHNLEVSSQEMGQLKTEEFYVNMGPQHPSTHGVLRLILKMDGEVIKECTPVIGYLHRSVEKIAENTLYQSFVPFTDRLDYISAMYNNWAYVLAVERLADIWVPPRAEYLRVIMGEMNRIASHLLWYGCLALDLGATTPFLWSFREREYILDLFEEVCGARLTYNYYRIGGVSRDLPQGWEDRCKALLKGFMEKFPELDEILTNNVIFVNRTKGVGAISKETCIAYGATGPVLRASGMKWDLRKDEPYSVYPELKFEIPVGRLGDTYDRYLVRMEEMRQSVSLVEQALEKLPRGKAKARMMSQDFRIPEGEIYSRVETPRGEMGYYIVSDGGGKPYRLKIRTPSFSHISLLTEAVKETKVADAVAIIASFDPVLGESDR